MRVAGDSEHSERVAAADGAGAAYIGVHRERTGRDRRRGGAAVGPGAGAGLVDVDASGHRGDAPTTRSRASPQARARPTQDSSTNGSLGGEHDVHPEPARTASHDPSAPRTTPASRCRSGRRRHRPGAASPPPAARVTASPIVRLSSASRAAVAGPPPAAGPDDHRLAGAGAGDGGLGEDLVTAAEAVAVLARGEPPSRPRRRGPRSPARPRGSSTAVSSSSPPIDLTG